MGRACAAAALCLLSVSICSSATFETVRGFLHQNVSFPFTRPSSTAEIVCKFDGNKVFEWESNMNTTYFGQFSGRTELKEGSVLIQKLQKTDAGFYLLQFTLENGNIEEANISLKVLVPLSVPTITCTGNTSIVYLSCDLNDHGSYVTTEWKRQNTTVTLDGNFYLSNENKHLTISNPEEFPGEYTCIVKESENSKQSNPFLVQNCFEKEGYPHRRVGIPIFLVFFLIAYLVVVFRQMPKCGAKNDKGKHEPVNTEENPKERETQNSPASTNVKNEDKVTPEASLDIEEELVPQNSPASNEPEKFREDSADIDNPKDMKQAPDSEQDGE